MGLVTVFYIQGGRLALNMTLSVMLFVAVSHFLIDYGKRVVHGKFDIKYEARHSLWWTIFGFDQLLHQTAIIITAWFVSK